MSSAPKITISLSGPLFQKDLRVTLRQNMRRMLQGMADEGEAAIVALYPVGSAGDPHPGLGRSGVVGRVASLSGKPWALTAVISEQHVYPWLNGGQKEYRGGKTEARVHMFRRTASALRHSRAVLMGNLTAGLE